jgi:hypothetical protein
MMKDRAMITVSDLVAEWKVISEMYASQIEFFEKGPGMSPPTPVETIRRWKAEVDDLIVHYCGAIRA